MSPITNTNMITTFRPPLFHIIPHSPWKTFRPVSVCIQTGEVVRWVSNAEVLFGWCVDTWPFHLWSKLFGDLAPDMAGAEVDQQREAHQVLCMLCYTQWGGSRRNIFQFTSIQKIKKFVWKRGVLVLCFCNELYSVYADEVCCVVHHKTRPVTNIAQLWYRPHIIPGETISSHQVAFLISIYIYIADVAVAVSDY